MAFPPMLLESNNGSRPDIKGGCHGFNKMGAIFNILPLCGADDFNVENSRGKWLPMEVLLRVK